MSVSPRVSFVFALLFICTAAAGSAPADTPTGHLGLPTGTPAPGISLLPWHSLRVRPGEGLSALFARAGLAAAEWSTVLDLEHTVDPLRHLRPGQAVTLRKTMHGRLQDLRLTLNDLDTLVVHRGADGLQARISHRRPSVRRVRVSGHVQRSLSGSLQAAGVGAAVAAQVADIFKWRVDLARELRPGDRFAVIYRHRALDGRRLPGGAVLAAEVHVGDRTLRAFRAVDADGDAHYYDAGGRSYQPSIERTPVAYTHVSSPFSLHRMNPVLHIVRPHRGVDLAAPRGTPVRAAADGQVEFRGLDGGYGRLIKLTHFAGYETRYAHLSAFATGLHAGEHVHQGEVIGFVGATGVTTGAHLHFEIRHYGKAQDPLHMALPGRHRLEGVALTQFSDRIVAQIARLDGHWPSPLRIELAASGSVGGNCPAGPTESALAVTMGARGDAALERLLCVPR